MPTIVERFPAADFPTDFRVRLGLSPDDSFIVLRKGDTLIMKKLERPGTNDFSLLLDKIHSAAKDLPEEIGPDDVSREIKAYRQERK